MKLSVMTAFAITALSLSARADYLEATRAEAYRLEQQRAAQEAAESARDAAARERVYASLSNAYAKVHGGYTSEIKRYGSSQPLSRIGWTQAKLIQSFSTGDGSECGVLLSFYHTDGGYRNDAILDCVNPTTGKSARKSVVFKTARSTMI